MVQVNIICVGTLKESYLKEGIDEYKKRLSAYCKVEEINIKEERVINEDNPVEIISALNREGEKILAKVPDDAYFIPLCVEGVLVDSVELASKIKGGIDRGGKICFAIGSSHGLSDSVKKRGDLKLSIGRLTFPHQLVRVMLYEIIYRSFSINAGKKYHK